MKSITPYIPLLMQGATITLACWACAALMSLLIGLLMGISSCAYFKRTFIMRFTQLYTFVAKGIPAYVQILLLYFALPSLLGINIPGFAAATLALGFCSSGYVTEIIRAGINAVPYGQWDACNALGYPTSAALARVILPQAVRTVLPALIGEAEQLLKSTALLATIGVTELTRSGMNIISRELNPLPVYLLIAAIYLLFSFVLTIISTYAERRMNNGTR